MQHAFFFVFGSLLVSRRPLNVQCQMLYMNELINVWNVQMNRRMQMRYSEV